MTASPDEIIYSNPLTMCGNTPMQYLQRITGDYGKIAVKLDFLNPTGSVKDRTISYMITQAEKIGKIVPGRSVLIEATSGNMGIALARCCAIRGYKCILVMPTNVSTERRALLKVLGAHVVLTNPQEGFDGMWKFVSFMLSSIPNSYCLDQFGNPDNATAHYKTTGPEIWKQSQGQVDAVVLGVGTGGTLSGTGRFLKEKNPNLQVFAVEPYESSVISGHARGVHKIQGIGVGMVPAILDRSLISEVVRIRSDDAMNMANRLATEEGILCGITSGANVAAALEVAKRPEMKNKLIVTTINDVGERYLSTELFKGVLAEAAALSMKEPAAALAEVRNYLNNNKR